MNDSNTEVFNQLANQWAHEIVEQIREAVRKGQVVGVRSIETDIRQRLRQLGVRALSLVLSQTEGTPAATQACACGGGPCNINAGGQPK